MMERAEVESIVRNIYESRSQGDVVEATRHFADQATFALVSSRPDNPTSIEVKGREAVRGAIADLIRSFEFADLSILRLIVDGNSAVSHIGVTVRAPSTGKVIRTELMDLVSFENGLIVEFRQFCDTAMAAWLLSDDDDPSGA